MRITDLNIDGFGKFNDFSINDLGEGLTVLHGENEAGKSTLLSFIRRMFFGFPDKRSNINHYPPFKGGLHGGRLSIQVDAGIGYTIERYAQNGLNIYLPDGIIKDENEIGKILGNADKDVFENVYAFGLDELQDFNKLNGDSINGKLYSAGTGIGAASIPYIQNLFEKKKGAIFKPTGKKPQINTLFTELNKIEQEINDIEDGQYAYDQLHNDIRYKEKEISDLKNKKSALLEKQEHVRSLLSVWDDWVDLQTHGNKIEELPKLESFPDNGLNRYTGIKGKIQELYENIAGLNSSIERNRKEQSNIAVDESLLLQKDIIFELGKGIEKYRAEKEELPKVKVSLQTEKKRFDSLLQELGPDWDEGKLNGFDRSIPAIDTVRKRHSELQAIDDEIKNTRQNLKRIEDLISRINKKHEVVSGKLLKQRSAILNIADRVVGYQANVGQIISNETKLDSKKKELTDILQDIGSNWDESSLGDFHLSSSAKEYSNAMASNFKNAELNIHDLEAKLEWAMLEINRINNNILKIDSKINAINMKIPEDNLREMLACLKGLRAKYPYLKEKEMDLKSLERDDNFASIMGKVPVTVSQHMPMWPAGAFVVLGFAVLAAGFVYENLHGGIIVCIVLFIVAIIYFISLRKSGISAQVPAINVDTARQDNVKEQAKREIQSIREQMLSDAIFCNFKAIPEISVLEERYDDLKEYALGLKTISYLNLERDKLEKDKKASSDQYAFLEAKLDDMRYSYQNIQIEWNEWLISCNLDVELAPDNISDKFALVREGKDKQAVINDLHSQLLMCEKSVEDFEEDAKKLLDLCKCDITGRPIDLDIIKLHDDVNAEYANTGKVEQLQQDHEELVEQSEMLNVALKEKEAERSVVLNKWKEWLAKYDLSSNMTTESILDIFAAIRNCYEIQDNIKNLAENIESYTSSIDVYEDKIRGTLDVCGRKGSGFGFDTELETLRDDVEKAVSEKNQLDSLISEMDKLSFSLKEAENKHLDHLNDMSTLLKEGVADSEDDFVSNAKIWDDLSQARNGYNIAELHLRKLSGNDDEHLIIMDELKNSKHDLLKVQESEIAENINEIDDELESLSNEKGSIKNQITQLEGYNEGSTLRLELGMLKEELNEKSREWATYSIAQHILSKAMERYEKERQPAVITEAQSFFINITGGKYERIYSPLDSSDIFVEDKSGTHKNIVELSRGTAEQLYLALRFGFIKELGKHSESLPIVFDDILVNFDPVRSRNAISSISELSSSNQVLYFTCHPRTVEMFRDVVHGVKVIELNELD
ncbi:AAA family ATPase [Methanococcoides burtonii]|uniref:ATPase domain-like membrane protein n=1 Tax=Methanococcoides burtonii (strain DSM 6242 / NBRC 107633 / OCM 468 / ACE-M) TaxID=259564 RepID=Q12WJ6_METBU|nr:AAA family ATPase [Methanococcoides burtonii]ABE52180.1 ATPase domain-like membrane protein [Methanococcoides burtonii DSM 6242]